MRRLLLLSFIFIITVSRQSYCADHVENPVSKGTLIAKLSVKNYIRFSVGYNFQYWLFGLYQNKPGSYFGRFYCSFGRRTRLFNNRFYFDFYYYPLLSLALLVALYFLRTFFSGKDISRRLKEIACVYMAFVPFIDLNVKLGRKFNLVIMFSTIFFSYLCAKSEVVKNTC